MLGTRTRGDEVAAVREAKNEFMLLWDGLRTREWERVVVLGATNRPFDLDDAALRRMPRRILVALPEREAREHILRVLLRGEVLDDDFSVEEIARHTEGFSGSDLKALCVRAAHVPIRELLDAEKSAEGSMLRGATPPQQPTSLRTLRTGDFFVDGRIGAPLIIAPSVSHQSAAVEELRRWNERFGEQRTGTTVQLSYYT